ncbi:hypothetical protein [Autumnicola edwardsiae]|uniref:Uncharacterized protein n=1 Tax=Autumnicola edwardsiae TaxID=3075594 RepID=A0ABU3CZU4_9FLAO|nr:hypothetical protein [Zunongwangia sp. F297]MDT0651899.1 hypothetical protein [Zunongwangia sp. F297]
MNTNFLKIQILLFVLVLYGCTDQGEYKGRYIIENATEKTVKIKFFKRQPIGEPILVLTKEIGGAGIIYDEIRNFDNITDREIPEDVFGADSLAVIFDGEKIQAHYEGLPFGNSLVFFSDYIQNSDTNRYIITEQNFENAVDCNNNCD